MSENNWIAKDDQGHDGGPGGSYSVEKAMIRLVNSGRYEVKVISAWGSNQGYYQEQGSVERRYRAGSIDEVMRVAIAEIRADSELQDSAAKLAAAVRNVCFEAEDAEDAEAA